MALLAIIIATILALIFSFKIGYSTAKKNVLIHLISKKIISSEQYQQLADEDI
jgi:hypothetical protein